MLPEFPPAARISEYVCDLEYLFSRMNSYGPTEGHLWPVGRIPPRMWEDCRSTSERKRSTHTWHDLVDLLVELALEGIATPILTNFSRATWGQVPTPPLILVSCEGPKPQLTLARLDVRGVGYLLTMKEVNANTSLPGLFYSKPVNDLGGPCHASDCNHGSRCVLQIRRQQHTRDVTTVNCQDH